MSEYYQGLMLQPDCHLCPLQHDKKVLPDGPVPAKICYVGEGPGYNEVIEGRGFVGASGGVLWTLTEAMGFSRSEVWVTNAALCRPRIVKLATGASIPQKQVIELSAKACRKRLIYELLCVTQNDPNAVVVPLGKVALQSLSQRKNAGIYAYRGSLMPIDLQQLWQEAQTQQAGW